jgi:hypothetical protein
MCMCKEVVHFCSHRSIPSFTFCMLALLVFWAIDDLFQLPSVGCTKHMNDEGVTVVNCLVALVCNQPTTYLFVKLCFGWIAHTQSQKGGSSIRFLAEFYLEGSFNTPVWMDSSWLSKSL